MLGSNHEPYRFSTLAVVTWALVATVSPAQGDGPSTANSGINSQGLGLTGAGINIGQVEGPRAGLPSFDNAGNSNLTVIPAAVFLRDGGAVPDADVDDHSEHVAGIMISLDSAHLSVAVDAALFSSAYVTPGINPGYQHALLAMQHVATQAGGSVVAVNLSYNKFGTEDGQSLLTSGLDWSARSHDVLYVVSRQNVGATGLLPADNYIGIVVASSSMVNGIFRQASSFNHPQKCHQRKASYEYHGPW